MPRLVRNLRHACLVLILIASASLFFRLGELPFIGPDEPRYARIAEEMLQESRWVTPLLEGDPWLEKPPLYYWITIPAYGLLGVGEATARLGPALLALLASLSILWLGARVWSLRAGVFAGSILLSSLGFATFGRGASTDMPLTACLTVALALLAGAVLRDGSHPAVVLAGYGFLGAAVLAKGPVALVLAAGILLSFWCFDEAGGSLRRLRIGWGIVVVLAVALPWFILVYRENGFAFVSVFLINHNLARFVSGIHHHAQPVFYYLPILAALMFPWIGWLPVLAPSWRALRKRREWDRRLLFLACWVLFPLVFFSLSEAKLPGYVLPVLPPLALLLGVQLAALQSGVPSGGVRLARWSYLLLCVGAGAALPFVFHAGFGGNWQAGMLIGAVIAAPAPAGFLLAGRGAWGTVVRVTVLHGVLLVLAFTQFGFPSLASYHSTREIARLAVSSREQGEPAVPYRFFHHTLRYYSEYTVGAQIRTPAALAEFADRHGRFLVITEAHRVRELRDLPDSRVEPLGEQGKLRLLRVEKGP